MNLPLRQYWQLLSRHIQPQKGRFTLLSVLLLGSIGLQIINPQIMRAFIDAALGGEAVARLLAPALAFIALALLQQAVSISVTYLGENVAWTATNALRSELAQHCLNLDLGFHSQHTPGELIERIDGDVTEMASFFSQFVITMLGNLLLLFGILVALMLVDWRVGLAFSVYAVIAVLTLNRVRDLAIVHQKDRRQAEADLFGFIEEQLSATEDIRANGAVGFCLRQLYKLQTAIYRHDLKAQVKDRIIFLTMGAIMLAGNLMAIGFGYAFFVRGAITIGTVYLFINYINLLERPLHELTYHVETFQTIAACVERLSELRKIQSRLPEGGELTLPGGSLGLAFERVSFSYQASEPVLNELTFCIEPGSVLGLLGRTGSGKTTLARLVFRLYDPTHGEISLDGTDLRSADLASLRSRVAMVTQDVQLFRASVRDNLTFFDRSISDERIQAAINTLELADWYRALPSGLDTVLERGSQSLSAGEAQLLAFTRIFLRDPGLVILDEASSRLDPATEQRVERAVDHLLQGRTAIIIAHRLGTVGRAGQIMILEDGVACEFGPRRELAADPASRFYQLLKTGLEEVLA